MQADWQTPAGKALMALAEVIRARGLVLNRAIIVFGSAPLQLFIDPSFLSGEVDIACAGKREELKKLVAEIGYAKGQADFYIEVVGEHVFRATPNWQLRAQSETLHGIVFVFPHPNDVLIAKMHRLDA